MSVALTGAAGAHHAHPFTPSLPPVFLLLLPYSCSVLAAGSRLFSLDAGLAHESPPSRHSTCRHRFPSRLIQPAPHPPALSRLRLFDARRTTIDQLSTTRAPRPAISLHGATRKRWGAASTEMKSASAPAAPARPPALPSPGASLLPRDGDSRDVFVTC